MRVSSTSNVYVNSSEAHVVTPLVLVNNEDTNNCDNTSAKMVSESLRNSKDLPKIRNKIFEESLESQEISYYIGELIFVAPIVYRIYQDMRALLARHLQG